MKDLGLTPDILLQGYAAGVFPMAETRDSTDLFWLDPTKRGVLPLNRFHISRSLGKALRRGGYGITLNRDFAGVVTACADRDETWINTSLFDLYLQLHHAGFAHSLEVRDAQGGLIGGVFGIALGGAFFGESMFSRRTDASKIALAYLVDRLRRCGFKLFDTQFITPHLATLGGIEIPRAAYRRQLREALTLRANIRSDLPIPTAQDVMQRNTQTS